LLQPEGRLVIHVPKASSPQAQFLGRRWNGYDVPRHLRKVREGAAMRLSYSALAYRLPKPLRRHILHFETEIADAVVDFAGALPAGARVLDAGAGEGQYAHCFTRQRNCGVDLAVGNARWDYSRLDVLADLTALPFRTAVFDAALNMVTLEHLREPGLALREIARTLAPGGRLLIAAPHEWEVHQAPHDYFRYTHCGLQYLLKKADLEPIEIRPVLL
jgi:SAM-dependent methyltransferase